MSSSSLKAYAPKLARLLQSTPNAIYERQRALGRAELLDLGEGQGPGKGTRATADGIALILISMLTTERLSYVEGRVREVAAAREINPPDDTPFKKREGFRKALAYILTQPAEFADQVIEVGISRTCARAVIVYRDSMDGTQPRVAEFAKPGVTEPPLRVMATLEGKAIAQIAADVRAMLVSTPDPLFGDVGARRQAEPQA
jgi:hypothetical protein